MRRNASNKLPFDFTLKTMAVLYSRIFLTYSLAVIISQLVMSANYIHINCYTRFATRVTTHDTSKTL